MAMGVCRMIGAVVVAGLVVGHIGGVAGGARSAAGHAGHAARDFGHLFHRSEKETRQLSVAHVAGSAVNVKTKNGSVKLIKGGTDTVTIVANISAKDAERLGKIKVTAVRESTGELAITADFPEAGWLSTGGDGCSFDITVPDITAPRAKTSNGSITADGFTGAAVYETSNGHVNVHGHDGSVKIKTSNGSVKADDISGSMEVRTSNAHVELDQVGTPLDLHTSNGSVRVKLRADAPGPVDIDTSNAGVELVVGTAFAGTLKADTSNAKVTVESADGATVNNAGKHATIEFPGESKGSSTLKSSNGGVKIKQVKR